MLPRKLAVGVVAWLASRAQHLFNPSGFAFRELGGVNSLWLVCLHDSLRTGNVKLKYFQRWRGVTDHLSLRLLCQFDGPKAHFITYSHDRALKWLKFYLVRPSKGTEKCIQPLLEPGYMPPE